MNFWMESLYELGILIDKIAECISRGYLPAAGFDGSNWNMDARNNTNAMSLNMKWN